MKKPIVFLCAAAACMAAADTYTWKTAADGGWSVAGNWTSSTGSAYPNNGDTVGNMAYGGYTVTLTEPITLAQLSPQKGGGVIVFDLNGQTLTTSGNNSVFPSGASAPTSRGDEAYTVGTLFRNGTMACGGLSLGIMPSGKAVLDLSNVTMSAFVNSWSGSSRIILRDGSVWNVTGETRIEPGLWHTAEATRYPSLIAKGAGVRINSASYDVIVGSLDGGMFLKDGALGEFNNVNVGGTFRSTNAIASVYCATLTANGTLRVGTDNINPTNGGKGTFRCDRAMGRSATLKVGGTTSLVTAETVEIYENTDAAVEIDVPEDGFADAQGAPRAPIQSAALAFVPRSAAYDDFGPTHLRISCYDWTQAHPEETIALLELETANAAALATLAGYAVWTDYPADLVAAGKGPLISVSQDGTQLLLTAPAINRRPVFDVSTGVGPKAGEKSVTVSLTDYGSGSSDIVSIECEYADNPDFTGSAATNFLAGLPPVSASVPCAMTYRLDGSFVQHRRYWARVRLTNDGAQSSERMLTFTGDAVEESLTWFEAVDGNFEDAARWKTGDAPAGTFPHGEDSVSWKANSQTHYTVTFTNDAAVAYFAQYGTASHSPITLDLGGHSLTMNDVRSGTVLTLCLSGTEEGGANTNWCGSTMLLRNGTVSIPPTAYSASGFALGGSAFGASSKVCGTLVLEDRTSFTANIKYFMNSSRFFVLSGSEYHAISQELRMQNHTANCGNGRIMVAGTGSLFDMNTYNLYVRGDNAVCEVLDGGRLVAGKLLIGGTNHLWGAGTVASDNTQVRFDNGTAAISGDVELGWFHDMKCNARLELAGTNASVVAAGALKIHEHLASTLALEVPVAGYNACPLQVGSLEFVAKPDGNTDYGATRLSLSVKAWMKAHPCEEQELVLLATPNAAALEQLKAYAVFADVSTGRYPGHEFLVVSGGGTKLVLRAPARNGAMLIFR